MRTLKTSLITLTLAASTLTACGGAETPPPAPAPHSATTPPPPAPSAETKTPPPSSDPTVLSDEQKKQIDALVPTAAALVGAYGNSSAVLSKDKKRVLYRSNRGGVPAYYLGDADKPAETPKAITTGPERAMWAGFSRDEKYILFTRDQGADENFRIYRAKPDGSETTRLTPGETLQRDPPLLPRDKPSLMVYSTHKTATPNTTLVTQSIEGGEPKVIYNDPLPGQATSVTPDGARALLVHLVSYSEMAVLEVDIASGKTKQVYPPQGKKAAVTQAAYSADGKRIFVATDDGGESSFVLGFDAASGKELARFEQKELTGARIDDITVSPGGDRLALTIDAGTHSQIRFVDAKTLKPKGAVATPPGAVSPGEFSADGKSFTLTASLADRPGDVFVADVASGAVKPLRSEPRPGLDGLGAMKVSLTKIKAFDGLSIPVNVYLPDMETPRRLPTIVSIHGGPASSSKVRYSPLTRFFVSQGFVVVEPNIRGSTGFGRAYEMADNREKRGDALKDVESVNRWAREQPYCDPDKMVIFGGSYGGYMVLMGLTRQPSIWRAGIDLVGISDLKTFLRSTDQAIRSVFVDEFGDLDKDAALLEAYSPMRDVGKIASPLFVYQGANDPRVPKAESDAIVRVLRGRGVPVEYMLVENEGHSLDRRENQIAFMTRTVRFLRDELKLEPPAK